MTNFIVSVFDFFIPRFCPACKTKLPPGSAYVCKNCILKIKRAEKERIKLEFQRKFVDSGVVLDFTSLFLFEKDKELQHIIHALKYEKRFLLGVFLGKLLGETISKYFSTYNINFIVPVPLHRIKRVEREFNQSFYISKGISKTTGIRVSNHLLKRSRYTESQTSMNLADREENVNGAFINKKKLNGENLLIVDDVITTGATVRECGKVLLDAGAGNIYAASVAIAD